MNSFEPNVKDIDQHLLEGNSFHSYAFLHCIYVPTDTLELPSRSDLLLCQADPGSLHCRAENNKQLLLNKHFKLSVKIHLQVLVKTVNAQ